MALIKLNNQSLTAVTSAGIPIRSKSVLQVVSDFTTASHNTSSTTFVNSGFSVSITPTFTTSKVFVIVSIPSWYIQGGYAYATVFRDSTNIGDGNYGLMMGSVTASYAPSTMQVMDSPSSTSSLTYSLHHRSVGGDEQYISYPIYGHLTMTLMEIAG
jgi:hypothetical protein